RNPMKQASFWNSCPYCGKRAVSFGRKLVLAPGRSFQCNQCGRQIGLPYWPLLLFPPSTVVATFALPLQLHFSASLLVFLFSGWIYLLVAPLIKKEVEK